MEKPIVVREKKITKEIPLITDIKNTIDTAATHPNKKSIVPYSESLSSSSFPRGRRVQTTVKKAKTLINKSKLSNLHDHICNHHEKYIEISTKMPVVDSLIRELALTIQFQKCEKANKIVV